MMEIFILDASKEEIFLLVVSYSFFTYTCQILIFLRFYSHCDSHFSKNFHANDRFLYTFCVAIFSMFESREIRNYAKSAYIKIFFEGLIIYERFQVF